MLTLIISRLFGEIEELVDDIYSPLYTLNDLYSFRCHFHRHQRVTPDIYALEMTMHVVPQAFIQVFQSWLIHDTSLFDNTYNVLSTDVPRIRLAFDDI